MFAVDVTLSSRKTVVDGVQFKIHPKTVALTPGSITSTQMLLDDSVFRCYRSVFSENVEIVMSFLYF